MPKTGATRYQKFLKSEKSKTKLKSRKDLPKGTNKTKTNFKVRKIVIKDQLKQHDSNEVLSKKRLSLKELLSRLHHFNVNSISEGISGLKEILTNHSEMISQHLGELINGIAPLVIHIEKLVRRESFKLIHVVLSKTQTNNIVPFSEVLCSYLRCAMTHIDKRIQEDSLFYLDVLLNNIHEVLLASFHKILPSFMDMISKVKQDSQSQRVLTVNMDSQLTSQKWRIKVLYRLNQFMTAYINHEKSNGQPKNISTKTVYFNENSSIVFPIYNQTRLTNCSLACFSPNNEETFTDQEEIMKKHIDTLMGLLFDSWIEAGPSSTNKTDTEVETMLSEVTATHLKHLVDVFHIICEHMVSLRVKNESDILNFFSQKYINRFGRNFIDYFPYITNSRILNDKNKNDIYDDPITDPKMIKVNIKLCNIFVYANYKFNKQQANRVSKVLNYVVQVFGKYSDEQNDRAMVALLHNLFSEEFEWREQFLLDNIIWTYKNKSLSTYLKNEIFTLLCKISLSKHLSLFHTSGSLCEWQMGLGEILCEKTVSAHAIATLQLLATQNNKLFNDAVKPILPEIIKNLPQMSFIGEEKNVLRSKLLCLMYWINGWDETSLDILQNELASGMFTDSDSKLITEILQIKVVGALSI